MRFFVAPARLAAFALPLLLAGCSLLPTTRKLPVPKAPSIVHDVSPQDLVAQLNQHWDAVHSLTATVEIQATETKGNLAKAWPSARGFILIREPSMMRVVGQYFGARIFDMSSDGQHFTLEIPLKDKVIEGSNSVTEKSSNPLENLRPRFFLDAMIVKGVDSDDFYSVASDTETVEDAAKKHLLLTPEYVLTVLRRDQGSQQLNPVRVVTFHRDDLMPYEQDVYNPQGVLESHIIYSSYQKFDAGEFPSRIVINRPIEGIQITLSVEKVSENLTLPDDQFHISIPPGATIQVLE